MLETEKSFKFNKLIKEFTYKYDSSKSIKDYDYRIELHDAKVFKTEIYNIPIKFELEFKNKLNRLLNLGIISSSEAKSFTLCFAVSKPNGEIRILNDFRPCNALTVYFD